MATSKIQGTALYKVEGNIMVNEEAVSDLLETAFLIDFFLMNLNT